MGADQDAAALQNLAGNPSRRYQTGRQSAGKMAAAADVIVAAVADKGGIIRMAGAGVDFQVAIILGADIGILNNQAQRRTGGYPIQQSAQNAGNIALFAGGAALVAAGGPAGHLPQQGVLVDGLPGGKPVDYHSDCLGVTAAENGNMQIFTECR